MPKILVWDIETGYNLATTFSLFADRLPHTSILEERYIICAAFKELGKSKVWAHAITDDKARFKANPRDDAEVVRRIHAELSSADAIIAHYGDKFDLPFFNSRCIFHGLPPLPPIKQIDTYKIARSKFKFNSNKLDYLGKYFGIGGKMSTPPGLWHDCFVGKRAAVNTMVKYNKQDVELLEEVYVKLAPYAPAHLNMNLYLGQEIGCPLCGSDNVQKRGIRTTKTTATQRYQCNDCGHWSGKPMLSGIVR